MGYHIACNGDVSTTREKLFGFCRGRLHCAKREFSTHPTYCLARWWKTQFRGAVGFFASFVGLTRSVLAKMSVIDNAGARRVAGLPQNCRAHSILENVKNEFNISVSTYYVQCIVKRLGHVFRHPTTPICRLLSLPLEDRLASLRMLGRPGEAGDARWGVWNFFSSVGLQVEPPIGGKPNVRSAGVVIRWGHSWFEALRDGGEAGAAGGSSRRMTSLALMTKFRFCFVYIRIGNLN